MKNRFLAGLGMTVFILVFTGCGESTSSVEKSEPTETLTYQVYLDLIFEGNLLLNQYDVEVYFGEEEVGTIKHGDNFTLLIDDVIEGEYELIFYEVGDESVTGSTKIKVKDDTTFKCIIHAKGSEISIDGIETLSSIEGNSIVLPDLVDQNLQETLDELQEAGFINVTAMAEDDSIWNNSNWTVVSQNIDAKTEIDKNTEVILTCIKTMEYMKNAFTNVTLAVAKEKAEELGYSIVSSVNMNSKEDMTSQVENMSDEESINWNVIETEVTSLEEKQIKIMLVYGASIKAPSVVGESLSSAIEILKRANIYYIEEKTEDGSDILKEVEWTVIEQGIEAGSSMNADDKFTLICRLQNDIEEEETAKKNAKLEEVFPVEFAKRAAIVAITNSCATDVFDESGNNYDVTKFHTYSDTAGNFYDYYISVDSWGNWKAVGDSTWHVESLLLENSLGTDIVASLDVMFDGENYTVKNIVGTLGNSDLNLMIEDYNKASSYLKVSLDMIAEDRVENRLDSHRDWIADQFSIWDGSHKVLKDLIKDNLNDEKSFEHIETSYVEIINDYYKDEINGILKSANINQSVQIGDLWITTEFSAKNSFNATVKNTAYGIASFSENQVILVTIE